MKNRRASDLLKNANRTQADVAEAKRKMLKQIRNLKKHIDNPSTCTLKHIAKQYALVEALKGL